MKPNFQYKVLRWYCIIFYALMVYKWANGLFMYQLQPAFFYTRQDLSTWLLMQTGIHQWLLNNSAGNMLFDSFFYGMPVVVLLAKKYQPDKSWVLAIAMLCINWIYIQCYTLYPSNSIEAHTAWLLFPVVFITSSEERFELLYRGIRYFFLYFFMSAGVWKLAQGGAFNPLQMNGILLYQHHDMLVNSAQYWQTNLYNYLLVQPYLGYALYLAATALELFFIIGFFTSKHDKLLAALFIIFLISDYFFMRISYVEVLPFLLPLLYKPAAAPQLTPVENP